jgi:hypothetical protein
MVEAFFAGSGSILSTLAGNDLDVRLAEPTHRCGSEALTSPSETTGLS